MMPSTVKEAALPWFANLLFASRAYNRGLEENARIDRQRLEAEAINERLRELESIRMAPVIEPLRHTRVPTILSAGMAPSLSGGFIPLGMDEGMVRIASALEKTAALMARNDVDLLKEARGLGDVFGGAVAATKKGLGGLLSSAKNLPGDLITGVRSKVPGPRISSPAAGLGSALRSPGAVSKTLHDPSLLSPGWMGQSARAQSFIGGAPSAAKAPMATQALAPAPARAVAATQAMEPTARIGSPAATAIISPTAASPAAVPPPPAVATPTLASPGAVQQKPTQTLKIPERPTAASPEKVAPPPTPAAPTEAEVPQRQGFSRAPSFHQTRQEVPLVATAPNMEALRPTPVPPEAVSKAQEEFGKMRDGIAKTQPARAAQPPTQAVAPPPPSSSGMPWTTKAMLGLGAGALGTAYVGGKAFDAAGRILAPHELPSEQWGTSWGMPPMAVNQYGQPTY